MGASAGEIAVAMTGVGGAIQGATKLATLFKAELDGALQVARELAGTQKGIAGSQRGAMEANGPNSDLKPAELTKMAEASGLPLSQTYAAMEGSFKAAGTDFSHKQAAATALEVGKLNRTASDDELRTVSGAAVDLQQQTGLTGAQAAAQIRSSSRRSESSQGEVAKALPGYLSRAKQMGIGLDEASALATSIEGTQNEGFGSAAKTAEKFLIESQKAGFTGSVQERIEQARSSNRFQEHFRGEGFAPIASLLDPNGEAAKKFAASNVSQSPDDVLKREQGFAAELDQQPGQLVAKYTQQQQAAKERAANLKTVSGITATARDREQEALRLGGVGVTERTIVSGLRKVGGIAQSDQEEVDSIAGHLGRRANEAERQGDTANAEILRQAMQEIKGMAHDMRQMLSGEMKVSIVSDKRPGQASQKSAAEALNDR